MCLWSTTIAIHGLHIGIQAVLTQQSRPIAFMSQALGTSKLSWSIYVKEMLSIIEAI